MNPCKLNNNRSASSLAGYSLKNIKLLVVDCDGVMTDGFIPRRYNIKDGAAMQKFPTIILTAVNSKSIEKRAEYLGTPFYVAGDKLAVIKTYCDYKNLSLSDVAYIGDDLPDIDSIQAVGFGCCPADAEQEVKEVADYISLHNGGYGVIREIINYLRKEV